MHPGDAVVVDVEKPVAGGQMLARHGGRVVLVTGAIPGERVRARIDRVAHGAAHATATEILTASSDRREPRGDWTCGGNAYAHVAYPRQRALKAEVVADAFARIARRPLAAPVAVEPSPEHGYRMRARLHGRSGRLGFFREGTHELCDAATSGQLLDDSVAVLDRLRQRLAAAPAPFPTTIELSENVPASERAVHVELPAAADPRAFVLDLRDPIDGLTGLLVSAVGRADEACAFGSAYVTDDVELGDAPRARVRRHVRAFFQGNRYLLSTLVGRVLERVPRGAPVTDLYAGGGLFAVSLAAAGWERVTAIEGDGTSAADLLWNARAHAPALTTAHRSVESYLAGVGRLDGTLLVDPPRTGVSPDAMRGIIAARPATIVYVSCDVATLARDARRLIEAGYELAHLEAFDLFPNTAHVESLAVFTLHV